MAAIAAYRLARSEQARTLAQLFLRTGGRTPKLKPRDPSSPPIPKRLSRAPITLTNGIIRDCRAESGRAQYVGFFVQYERARVRSASTRPALTGVGSWKNATKKSARAGNEWVYKDSDPGG